MLLLNKADLLTREQRRAWAKHFQKEGMRAVFWSALAESDRLDAEEKVETSTTFFILCFSIFLAACRLNNSVDFYHYKKISRN